MGSKLSEIRERLHEAAELSGQERNTASILIAALEQAGADEILRDLGGHGVAAIFNGGEPGPSILLRSDMDALPAGAFPAGESVDGPRRAAHLCGHDGHMATLLGVAEVVSRRQLRRGRVILLFQPAEETGQGARLVLDDPAFARLKPDHVIAQHNLPGHALGRVVLRKGIFASASRGLIVTLNGRSSHAGEPHLGRSPVSAAAVLALQLQALAQRETSLDEAAQVTVVGLEVGGPNFGMSPGDGRVMATLRAHTDAVISRLVRRAEELARGIAGCNGLDCEISWVEEFPATHNDSDAVDCIARVASRTGMDVGWIERAFSWSEDFGHFTASTPGALFGLGSGVDQPALHTPGYEFPDSLLEPGRNLFVGILEELLGPDAMGPGR